MGVAGVNRTGLVVSVVMAVFVLLQGCSLLDGSEKELRSKEEFRNSSIEFIRRVIDRERTSADISCPDEIMMDRQCTVVTVFFLDGERKSSGRSFGAEYPAVLEDAVLKLYEEGELAAFSREDLKRGRFYVAVIFGNGKRLSFVEYNGRGLPLTGKVTTLRFLDKDLILENIDEGKEYLLRMIDPEMHGIFKRYDAVLGKHDGRLRTIFTSSTLYTLLKMNDMKKDERIDVLIPKVTDFILSMQKQDGPYKGAFHYSYLQDISEKENRFVVGTASKTIFTLLELYKKTGDERYMEAAKNAGEWILTMIRENGTIINSVTLDGDEWKEEIRFSYLYNGQCLSALSRMYTATGDDRYLKAANKIAGLFMDNSKKESYFVSDGWRSNNYPVPTSWVIMSLLDYYKVTGDKRAKEVILLSADEIVRRQENNPSDIRDYGRYHSTATSGSGWIVEILSEVHDYGKKNGWSEVEKYKESMLKGARWIIQNTYSPENTYAIKNPETVYGGPIHQYHDDAVRTDAVCHGVNGYIGIMPYITDEDIVMIPEKKM